MKTLALSFLKTLAFCLYGLSSLSLAQETPAASGNRAQQLVGETVADRPSSYYTFETYHLESADDKRRYRIQIALPRTPVTESAPVTLYMLDGNAAIDSLTDADLQRLSERRAPVLVAVGYDIPTRNDVVARAYDYTPPVFQDGKRVEPVVRGRLGGGADIFLALLEDKVKPLVRSRVGTTSSEYLWGHSFGGLFAMHVLFTRPDAFSHYIVADPSAWWHEGALLREWEAFDKINAAGRWVTLLVGTKPRDSNRPPAPDAAPILNQKGEVIDSRKAVQEMAEGLKTYGAHVEYETFPQYGHGDMIRVSLERALEIASRP